VVASLALEDVFELIARKTLEGRRIGIASCMLWDISGSGERSVVGCSE
jgi:hypothetical protein